MTEFEGVKFFEGAGPPGRRLGKVSVTISRQNSNLSEVKRELALQARRLGGDAVVEYRYGQRAHRWFELLLPKWDTESWWGAGEAMRLDD
jgi:hypothetical protein